MQQLDWISPKQAAQKWGITLRHVQFLCFHGKIKGVVRMGKMWLIPQDALKPIDGRTLAAKHQKQENQTNNNKK